MHERQPLLPLLGWLAFLAASDVALWLTGPWLPGPPLRLGPALGRWVEANGAIAASFGTLRLATLCVGAILFAATVFSIAARLAGWTRAARWTALLTLPPVRQAVVAAVGISLGAAAVEGSIGTPQAVPSAPAPQLAHPPHGRAGQAAIGSALPRATSRPHPAQEPPGPPSLPQPRESQTWTVRAGEDFWSISAMVLQRRLGAPPSDATIADYCDKMIAANRLRLVEPSLPSLIYPGQRFVLPPLP